MEPANRGCQKSLRSGQGPWVSVGVRGFWWFSFGFRPGFLPSRPYFRACVFVGGLGHQGQETTLFQESIVFWHCRRRRHGKTNHLFPDKVCFWPPKKQLAKKTLRDPCACWLFSCAQQLPCTPGSGKTQGLGTSGIWCHRSSRYSGGHVRGLSAIA